MQALSQQQLNIVLTDYIIECKSVFGDKLYDVRLFGSYARGDFNEESDIDIIIILDMNDIEVRKSLNEICHITSEIELKYFTSISPVLRSKNEYDMQKYTYGFCKNVETEGISKYAGQTYA